MIHVLRIVMEKENAIKENVFVKKDSLEKIVVQKYALETVLEMELVKKEFVCANQYFLENFVKKQK